MRSTQKKHLLQRSLLIKELWVQYVQSIQNTYTIPLLVSSKKKKITEQKKNIAQHTQNNNKTHEHEKT
jgi:hypothetical protein